MVPGHHHHLEPRQAPPSLRQEAVPERLRVRRRVGRVEDVARDDQHVDPLGLDRVEQPAQELLVLGEPIDAVEGVPEVPVGRVEDAERHGDGGRIRGGRTSPLGTTSLAGTGPPL